MPDVLDADIIQERIDQFWENNADDGFRSHLGGSLIGRECLRELWYTFRWATRVQFKGRMLRLFQRGHNEEFAFVRYLRELGCDVRDYSQRLVYNDLDGNYRCLEWDDPAAEDYIDVSDSQMHIQRAEALGVAPKQWRISDVFGHFGGSLDGIAYNVPGIDLHGFGPDEPVLLEFKTHGQKSFDKLVKEGLQAAKPEHFSQMQVYMTKRGIKIGLYMAVNKNTDELKCFFVLVNPMLGAALISKAQEVITSPTPPKRISNNPAWFKCKFCDHRKVCHMGEAMERNCRTCAFSKPVEDGQWVCSKWGAIIPKDAQKEGCEVYHAIEG